MYNFIIIGAGSAGCVIANRLSANPNNKVLLIESGGGDINPWLHIPVGYFKTMHNPKFDWMYTTQNDPGINNRSLQWPRGKVLGGSSALNGLLYIRGDKYDYDNWLALGNKGWGYKDVLPYFIKSENQENGMNQFHGNTGELRVSNLRLKRPIADKFIKASQEIGIPFNLDFNGAEQQGVGYFQQTAYKGLRCSTAKAFLKPVLKRKNLTLLTKTDVEKIVFEKDRAIGVKINGSDTIIHANKEVILSAGAINSPKILQLSGIGDKKLLDMHNIKTIIDNPNVGKNLQDHLQIRLVYKTNCNTLNDELNKIWKKIKVGLQYILFRTGPLTLSASQVCIFTNTKLDNSRPNIQFHMQPLSADKPGDGVHKFSAFTASVCTLRPKSRGSVEIASNHFADKPIISPNYLSHKDDEKLAIESIKVARKIMNAPAIKNSIIKEYVPGNNYQTDDELLEAVRIYSQTIYHPAGTCKMSNDDTGVVDDTLKVRGTQNVRVVDASIMPEIVSGNTNAPTIMIGEKASDMILKEYNESS